MKSEQEIRAKIEAQMEQIASEKALFEDAHRDASDAEHAQIEESIALKLAQVIAWRWVLREVDS